MNKPYTIGTPEYYAWAKQGEKDYESSSAFTDAVEAVCELSDSPNITQTAYSAGRNRLKRNFDLFDSCECEGVCY